MATLVLTSAATAISGSAGFGFFATAALGLGAAVAGNLVDQRLFGGAGGRQLEGPRLDELRILTSTEGAPIPRVYGRARISGQVIWAAKFREVASTSSQSAGGRSGKGLGAVTGASTTSTTRYTYFARFAVALCEGEITRIGRVWADGRPLNLSDVNLRVYRGTADQMPDPLMEAIEGAGNAPAYRDLAYVMFEDLAIEQFGNRVPQLSFEVFRALSDVESLIRGVDLIPGSTEFGYDPQIQIRDLGKGRTAPENQNNSGGSSDWDLALDQLQATCANCQTVALVVSWFGTDLRAGSCQIFPGVENADKVTLPDAWQVDGVGRGSAHVVSQINDTPAYGGTPSDAGVVRAIADLKARGFRILFYPFVMMDIGAGNTLTDPYTGSAGQPVYPWRGRITCHPAPGVTGTPDKTSAAASQIAAFFGSANAGDFSVSGTTVSYSGAGDNGLRRMVLHYAHLCAAAGGVDAFVIGSELIGITTVRDSVSTYPAVAHLKSLAGAVKGLLPAAKISYAADWSEYFGHQPADGSGDVYFHLDPLWADANVDFVGVDVYMPLSDWREGDGHLDAQIASSIYDLAYLRGNIRGGEGYDWYYASPANRDAQIRTPISDGAYAKPWVYRYKDLWNWWGLQHFNRPGGVQSGTPTAWTPESKPIWFTETGCPAVDKGTNEPNKFIDPKSSESFAPHYSRRTPDDFIQRRFLQAIHQFWDPANPAFVAANNPVSTVYGGRMVDPDNIYVWTWDARPWPDFPSRTDLWTDAGNWRLGHWITGRLGASGLRELAEAILFENGFTQFDATGLTGVVDGFVIDRIMSAREALQPLMQAYFFDAMESSGIIRLLHRSRTPVASVSHTNLVASGGEGQPDYQLTRAQETELPLAMKLQYIDGSADYRQGSVDSRKLTGTSARVSALNLPIVMSQAQGQKIADSLLQETWTGRERARFALPPSSMALEPGDVIEFSGPESSHFMRIERVGEAGLRTVEAIQVDAGLVRFLAGPERAPALPPVNSVGRPIVDFLDLPLLNGAEAGHVLRAAAYASPWPGAILLYKSPAVSGYVLDCRIETPAVMGDSDTDFFAGPAGRWDMGNAVWVTLFGGVLESRDDLAVLGGANVAAMRNASGAWEVFQFANAELVAPNKYKLSRLLRGQAGTERAMGNPVAGGARFVLLNGAVQETGLSAEQRGLALNWRYGPASRTLEDFTYQSLMVTGRGVGLRPLSVAQVRVARNLSNNDLTISWARRTRVGGDSWEQTEVPLAEESERYEVDIMSGAVVKRTLTAAGPALVYTAAQQTADFGAAPALPLQVAVYQVSVSFGRGMAKEEILNG
ncbi:MAG: glycoside hydrolase/phage tail family protein [Alphaproteobacteria bacterium]